MEESNRASIERLGSVRVLTLPQLDLERPESWASVSLPG
jgi:hypothetical protein